MPTRFILSLLFVTLAGISLPLGRAQAQDADKKAKMAEAKQNFKDGRKFFTDGQYGEAVAAFQKAYELTGDGLVMGQVAMAYEKAGDYEGALKSITVYHDSLPKKKRGAVAKMMKKYNRLIKEGKSKPLALPAPPVQTPPVETAPVETPPVETAPVETAPVETAPVETTPVETKPVEATPVETKPVEATPAETKPEEEAAADEEGKPKRFYTWIAAGGAAALALSGLVVALNAQSKYDELKDHCANVGTGCSDSEVDEVKTRALVADVLFGVAAGAAITAGVLYFLEGRSSGEEKPAKTEGSDKLSRRLHLNPVVGGGTYGLSADITF